MTRPRQYMMAMAAVTLLASNAWAAAPLMDPMDSRARQHPHGFSRADAVDGEHAASARFDLPGGSRTMQGDGHEMPEHKRSADLVQDGVSSQR